MEFIVAKYNYWIVIVLLMIGLYAMIAKNNLIKKLIGMCIFQTAVILFYVSTAAKSGGATIPIIEHGHGHEAAAHAAHEAAHHAAHAVHAIDYVNPLPHVLMLTAIVVAVSTTGVALALIMSIYKRYGTVEEDEILEQIK